MAVPMKPSWSQSRQTPRSAVYVAAGAGSAVVARVNALGFCPVKDDSGTTLK